LNYKVKLKVFIEGAEPCNKPMLAVVLYLRIFLIVSMIAFLVEWGFLIE
jgi:hypothetical protein